MEVFYFRHPLHIVKTKREYTVHSALTFKTAINVIVLLLYAKNKTDREVKWMTSGTCIFVHY